MISITHGQVPIKDRKGQCSKSTEQCQSCGISICQEHSMQVVMSACNEILFYISYSLCLAFRLCSSIIVFYTSLEVIKLAFLEIKVDMFVVYSLTSHSHLKQKITQCLKKIELCIF